MKTTILFSNVQGDITADDSKQQCSFFDIVAEQLKTYIQPHSNLVFVNAPGFKNDNLYCDAIVECFKKIDIHFDSIVELSDKTPSGALDNFTMNNRVYFLMGGNPLTQRKIIKDFYLEQELKDYDGVVVGMCAGAINLSKHSIITTDDDFKKPLDYPGLERVNAIIEPHFVLDDSIFTQNRLKEIRQFCTKLKTDIVAMTDESCIVVTDKVNIFGVTHTINYVE